MNLTEKKQFKILIVDDNMKNIQVLGSTLKEAHYIVGFATDGVQALNLLAKTHDYDLVLLDINMPVMNGIDTCKAMRQNENLKEIPVIFLTAHREMETIVTGLEAGAQDYVTKPFNFKELLARVDTQLQLKYKTDQIKNMNQKLEQIVAERTAKLVEANKKLETLDKTKSDLLTLISHELKTPLSGIIGFAQLLSDTVQEPEQKLFVEKLSNSAMRLIDFSETAVLITSLKLQSYQFEFKTHSLEKLIENKTEAFEEILEQKKLKIKINITENDIAIFADLDLISKAVHNIMNNAIRFSPVNGVIELTQETKDDYVIISVKDDGPGFSEEAMGQLFELFTATDIMHHYDGYGLGLAAVKLIMDIHNGKAEVKNEESGARVSIFIPLFK
jgi:two-component system, sensor histidine kinase and response regulator